MHGLPLASSFALADIGAVVPVADSAANQVMALVRARLASIPSPRRGNFLVRSSGGISVGKVANGIVFDSYCGSRSLLIESPQDGTATPTLQIARAPSISTTRFNHTVMHSFIPHALTAMGYMFLHAACVEIGGRGVLIAGDGGRGKSTIAAGFSRRGLRVLSEDVVRVDVVGGKLRAYPSYSGSRLRSDSFMLAPQLQRKKSGRFGLPKHRLDLSPSVANPRIDDSPVLVSDALFLVPGQSVSGRVELLTHIGTLQHLLKHGLIAGAGNERFVQSWLPSMMDGLTAVRGGTLSFRKSPEHFESLLDTIAMHSFDWTAGSAST